MIWSPACSSSGPPSSPGAIVMTAVWLREVCWSTRKNRPRWASASTTSIALRGRCGGAQRFHRGGEVRLHAAVDRDVHGPPAQELLDLADLPVGRRDERLAAEPRVHRHHQHQV